LPKNVEFLPKNIEFYNYTKMMQRGLDAYDFTLYGRFVYFKWGANLALRDQLKMSVDRVNHNLNYNGEENHEN